MKKNQAPASGAPGDSPENKALSLMNSGKYKEAIGRYKKLLHDTDNSTWRRQLAYCYLQRALAFATKGMPKEALVLWENHSQHTQPPYEAFDHYVTWLLQTNNQTRIQACLGQLSAQQLDKQYPALAAILGLLMMTDYPEFAQALPQDSALIAHFKVVQAALQAYQDNDLEAVNTLLKQLPYRSAFRDFRTLLNAAISASISTAQASSLLAKIPADSAYSQTARQLLAITCSGSALVQEVEPFNHRQRRIIGEIKGLNKKQIEFIEQLNKQKDRLTDKAKFNLTIRYQSLCGSEIAQIFCHGMLTSYPAGRRDFNKNFGPLSEFEENRLKALTYEHKGEWYDVDYYWKQCVQALIREGAGNALKIALIFRHIAAQQGDSERNQLLIESLEYDPQDRDSYLQILHYYSQQQETADNYNHWLSKTLKEFPQDIDVLTLAIQSATRNKAYKKATQYALKILKLDPLNTSAKHVLFSSHLANVRRLIQGKKFHLVENEIHQAEDLNIGKAYIFQTQLMRGLYCFSGQDKKDGLQQISESLSKFNMDPVNAHFQVAMEALLTGLPVSTILRELPPARNHLLSEPELMRFIQRLKQYALEEVNQEQLHKAVEKVKFALKKSLQQQDYDEKLWLTFCETLDNIKHFELLRHCAKLAQTKWKKPIWVYYRIYSDANGNPEQCTFRDFLRLEKIQEKASQENDHRAMVLIDKFLDRYYKVHPEAGFGFLEDVFGSSEQQDDFEDPMDKLFIHLPEDVFYRLNKKIKILIKKTTPERLIRELGIVAHDNNNILLAMMQEPDLFSSLLIIKAADDLGIDIGVSVDDVLECFAVKNQTSPNSFPF
jgi:hypothetical protein